MFLLDKVLKNVNITTTENWRLSLISPQWLWSLVWLFSSSSVWGATSPSPSPYCYPIIAWYGKTTVAFVVFVIRCCCLACLCLQKRRRGVATRKKLISRRRRTPERHSIRWPSWLFYVDHIDWVIIHRWSSPPPYKLPLTSFWLTDLQVWSFRLPPLPLMPSSNWFLWPRIMIIGNPSIQWVVLTMIPYVD